MRDTAELLARRLERDPHDVEAYDALRGVYRESGDFASLTNLVEGWAQFQTDPRLAGQGFVEAARSWREGSGDLQRTRDLLRKALQLDPSQRDATSELLSLLQERGDARELADFLDSHLRRLEEIGGEPLAMAALYARLGDVWRSQFERPDVAAPFYARALQLDPLSTVALDLTPAARDAEAPDLAPHEAEMSARLLSAEVESELEPTRKTELSLKLARLYVTPLQDLDAAVRTLRAALMAAPASVDVMHQLALCLARRATTRTGDDAERDTRLVSELYFQVAQAVPEAEASEYLEAALLATPTHDASLQRLEELATRLGTRGSLPRHWVNYLAHAVAGPNLEQRRLLLADAYANAGQLDDAIYCLEQARESEPDGPAARMLGELRARRSERLSQPPARTRRPSSEERLPRIGELRRAIHDAIAARNAEEAAADCRELLALEPADPEAFTFLEAYYRRGRDYIRLRDLLLASSELESLTIEARKQRLYEVATLCEAKLKDVQGAIEVWRATIALDPSDSEAHKSLKRLLTRTQRWDELASLLEREALATESQAERIVLLRQTAAIHRDKRKDLPEAAESLRQLLALSPETYEERPGGDAELAAIRDELCDTLLAIDNHVEAVPLLRERIALASDERDKLRLLRTLAQTLDERQGNPEAAFAVCSELLALRPKDAETLLRMERIDEQTGNVARLLDTLERRTALALRGERPALLARMAELAERQLDDADRAASFYARALDLEPNDAAILDALCAMFERRQRFSDLAELLKARIAAEKEPSRRIELERRRARVLKDYLLRDDEAADAYREILAQREDAEALQFLLEYARGHADAAGVAELAASLARVVEGVPSKRALLLERARVLRDELDRPREAARTLRELVEQVDPNHEPAISELAELCEQLGDAAGLAVALRRKHARTADLPSRAAIAQRLSDLCEHELRDAEAAISALTAWTRDDPQLAAPHRRLVKLLDGHANDRAAELITSYDALSQLEDDESARTRAALDAANLAWRSLRDVEGAFLRLGPLVEAGHDDAFEALADISQQAERSESLAGLCVTAAQRARDPLLQGKNWRAAAHVFAERLGNTGQALEAALRMLATDLHDRVYLGEVDEYAARANAWPRLAQVYERLLKSAADDDERVELLSRHADLLEVRAQDPGEAFKRVLRACALIPDDEGLLARAEELAKQAERGEELLALYDTWARGAEPFDRLELLLRAARLCDTLLDERERADAYLKAALAVAAAEPALWERVIGAAEALDRAAAVQQRHGPGTALRQLVAAHLELAERAGPELGPQLILRADGLLRERLRDDPASFDLLRQGVALFPLNSDVYEALAERATALERLDALDSHLAKCVDRALDPKTAATLLTRRVAVLEGPLGRPEEAVDVLTKLLQLRPDDKHAAARLRRTLRKARRFQDLLLVIHKQMQRVKDSDERLALLKESASIWESDLKNRFEARDAWRKALEVAPQDPEASAGLERVQRRLSSSQPLSEPPPPDAEAPASEPPSDILEAEAQPSEPLDPADAPGTWDSGADDLNGGSTPAEAAGMAARAPELAGPAAAAFAGGAPRGRSEESVRDDTKDLDVELDLLTAEEEPAVAPKRPSLTAPNRSHPPPPPNRSHPPPPPPAALHSSRPPPRK